MDIASHSPGFSAQVKDISARQAISPRYIEQIFQKLKRAGIVKSARGPSGGYYLSRKPEEITVGDVVRAAEGFVHFVECEDPGRNGGKACDRAEHCVTRNVWAEAAERLTAYFDSVTLQDLCNEARLKEM